MLTLSQINNNRNRTIETVRKQQHFEITGLHIFVQSGILDTDRRIRLDVDGHMPHYRG